MKPSQVWTLSGDGREEVGVEDRAALGLLGEVLQLEGPTVVDPTMEHLNSRGERAKLIDWYDKYK